MKFKTLIPLSVRCAALLIILAITLGALSGCGMIIINTPSSGTSEATTAAPETTTPPDTAVETEQPEVTEPPIEETTEAPETARPIDPIVFPDRSGEAQERLDALEDPVGVSNFDLIIASARDTADVIFCDETSPLYAARSSRNAMLYEKLEVDIKTIYESVDSDKLYEDLKLALQAGENAEIYLDLIVIPANQVGRFLSKGLIKDMRSLPFYDINSGSNGGSIGSSRYADLGDGTDTPEYLYTLYFNRTMLGKESTAKLYSAAESGALTWESIATAAKEISSRISDIGIAETASVCDLAVKLFGVDYIKKNASGVPVLEVLDSDLLKIDSLIESAANLTVYQPTEGTAPALDRFKSGEIPFYLGTLSDIFDLYDEKTEWGLLPLPSDRNLGAVRDDRPAVCLPITGTRLEQTSIWLTAFNIASGEWIRDELLRISIEKYLRDNSSCLSMSTILSQKAEIGFERVFAGYYDGLADATYNGVAEAALGNVKYSEIYAKKLTAINKKLGKLP